MNKNFYAVIMAGGIGSRFWPMSTSRFPKQFHDMLGTGESLLQRTASRFKSLIPSENLLVLTNECYQDLVLEQLPGISNDQVVLEPQMRNTAPCILLSALKIYKKNPDAIMIVAPSDHWIEDEDAFLDDVLTCFNQCRNEDWLVTLGIRPSFPNTGYGYIEYRNNDEEEIKKVAQFREKPDYETARRFVDAGNFLWNAGIFIWSAKSIITSFKANMPEMYSLLNAGIEELNSVREEQFIKENYGKAENISIDFGILERADNVFVKKAGFDWNDLGTWGSLHDKMEKDDSNNAVVRAKTLLRDSSNNMILTENEKLLVIEGLNDYIIVDREEVLMIYPKKKEQDIKSLLADIRNKYGKKYT
jgi:mannose-1-phosphate guanylyltransferase